MLELYKNIKEKRIELELSQDELAKLVGYSGKSMISKIEKGEVDLSTTMIKKFSEALHTTPSELMGDIVYNEKPDIIIENETTARDAMVKRAIEYYKRLNPDQQEMAIEYLEFLLNKSKKDE